jgi:hypothetical protein
MMKRLGNDGGAGFFGGGNHRITDEVDVVEARGVAAIELRDNLVSE